MGAALARTPGVFQQHRQASHRRASRQERALTGGIAHCEYVLEAGKRSALQPQISELALAVAGRSLDRARESGDPRFAGMVMAATGAWTNEATMPDGPRSLKRSIRSRVVGLLLHHGWLAVSAAADRNRHPIHARAQPHAGRRDSRMGAPASALQ